MITQKSNKPEEKKEQPSKVILAYDQTGKPKNNDGQDVKPSDAPKDERT